MTSPDSASIGKWQYCLLILAVTIVAVALRIPNLAQRPMHGDEAVHAIKFGELLEKGLYKYNPHEYHGPTLNYLTLISAWLSRAQKLTEVSEFTLRIVPVFFGVVLVALFLFLIDGMGGWAAVFAAVLAALSPAMVFFSRYYIQEMLLVCFSLGVIACGWRYARSKRISWAIFMGVFLGLMHATKETCIISFGGMVSAVVLLLLIEAKAVGGVRRSLTGMKMSHIVVGLAAGVAVSALFYSSFFSNPTGILDSVRTYKTYFSKAGNNSLHIHPWYYYLKMLLYSKYGQGPVWSEGLIVLLAALGFVVAVTGKGLREGSRGLIRFIAVYTFIVAVVYSAIPYKTPWSALSFLIGMVVLAGVGAVTLIKLKRTTLTRVVLVVILLAGGVHLAWQTYLGNYKYYADPRNPYVYAHPTTDVFTVVQRIEEYSRVHEARQDMRIEVICPGDDYWPLPWYLRSFSQVHWTNEVKDDIAASPLIIATGTDQMEQAISNVLYVKTPTERRQMYLYAFDKPYYLWLRPGVKLIGFARKDLWDQWQQQVKTQGAEQ
jgi:uncharacterized protein (TIGR03663 family)